MNYKNAEIKVDQFVAYLNEEKINLSPAFQRGHVWTLSGRRNLLKNVLQGKPIPAIFLYKEASGSRYSYNILDGKQRLESLILFIGNQRDDLTIKNWNRFLFDQAHRKQKHFQVELDGSKTSFSDLDEEAVRNFREYSIPTIEITLEENTSLDEIITLFVDINQQGVAVNRFDIVKAMNRTDPLLRSVFSLVALKQRRGQVLHFKMINSDFTSVLKKLKVVESATTNNSKVDRMWERLLELALFIRTGTHRKPVDILRSFISVGKDPQPELTSKEVKKLRNVFRFLKTIYADHGIDTTKMATDQTHFYTVVTTLAKEDLFERFEKAELAKKLVAFAKLLDGGKTPKGIAPLLKAYQEFSTKQTTDLSRRVERAKLLVQCLARL